MVKIILTDGSVTEFSAEEYLQLFKGLETDVHKPTLDENEIEINGVIYEKAEFGEDVPEKGDYIVFEEIGDESLTLGNPYLIECIDSWGDARINDDNGVIYDTTDDYFKFYRRKEFMPEAEILSNENVEVGDYFVLTDVGNGDYGLDIGDLVVLVHKDGSTRPLFRAVEKGSLMQYLYFKNVRRATPEEIVADTPNEREQSFLKFGRKVNEFKEGDIVELIRKPGVNGYDVVGSLHYIDAVSDEDVHLKHVEPLKEDIDTYTDYTDVKLVAPIERLN